MYSPLRSSICQAFQCKQSKENQYKHQLDGEINLLFCYNSGVKLNKIENEFYTVVLPQDSFDKNKSPYGLKYYFYLKEAIGKETQMHDNRPKMVDEFLVVFDVMERIAREYGLKLVMKKNIR